MPVAVKSACTNARCSSNKLYPSRYVCKLLPDAVDVSELLPIGACRSCENTYLFSSFSPPGGILDLPQGKLRSPFTILISRFLHPYYRTKNPKYNHPLFAFLCQAMKQRPHALPVGLLMPTVRHQLRTTIVLLTPICKALQRQLHRPRIAAGPVT